jgi:membrane-bound lytic murein transglycosylase A
LKSFLTPWQALNAEGQAEGLATGYYEPILHGSRTRTSLYRYPLYAAPDDLLTIDLETVVPELKGRRVRGRIEGRRVVPYFSRGEIEAGPPPSLQGREIVWIDDPVEVFFLQIQGSGRVELAEGGGLHVGYADQNGQPFRSVARLLIEKGELTVGQATLQGMKAWAKAHPDRVDEFLQGNPSYVFFKELPGDLPGPIGTLGSPLIGEGSVAVDARWIPLGAPVLVDTVFPLSQQTLRRFAMAQDTGGAINGAVRIDYFWGLGDPALAQAGRMRQKLKLWVFLPQGTHPEGGDVVPDSRPLDAETAQR